MSIQELGGNRPRATHLVKEPPPVSGNSTSSEGTYQEADSAQTQAVGDAARKAAQAKAASQAGTPSDKGVAAAEAMPLNEPFGVRGADYIVRPSNPDEARQLLRDYHLDPADLDVAEQTRRTPAWRATHILPGQIGVGVEVALQTAIAVLQRDAKSAETA